VPARAGFGQCGRRAGGGAEDVDDLRQQRHARVQRDLLAGQALRLALAVPVLVQAVDALGRGVREAQLAGDVGAALAARLDQVLRDLRAVAQDVQHAAQPVGQAGVQPGVAEDEAQHLRQAFADELEIALELQVVGEVELADAGRVAAAAQVLEQQRLVQLPALPLVQADLVANVGADPAAAQAVPLGLALGDVQRVAERAHQLRQAQPGRHADGRGRRRRGDEQAFHAAGIGAIANKLNG